MDKKTSLPQQDRLLTVREAMAHMPAGFSEKWVRQHHEELGGKMIGGRILFPPRFWESWNTRAKSDAKTIKQP